MTEPAATTTAALVREAPRLQWRLFVAETTTGRIIEDVPFVGNPQWSHGLNTAGHLQVTVPVGAIDKAHLRSLLDYWRLSWGLAWGAHIVQCGPVVTSRFDDVEGPPTVAVGATGIWGLFATKRLVANPLFSGSAIASASADTTLTGLSLHTIAKRLVANDLARNGSLPIALPDDIAGTSERYYPGYDMAYVGERLQQLTQVINGPELEFRPRFTDFNRTAIEWEMRIGNPRLGNLGLPHAWDYGAALTHVSEDGDGSQQQFRAWTRGNGMERGLLTGYYEDDTYVDAGWPMLEHVDSDHSSTTEVATLNAWAEASVQTHMRSIHKLDARVRWDGTDGRGLVTGSPGVDQVQTGDTATFNLRGHRWLPDGVYGQRIIGVSSSGDLPSALLTLQGVTL